MKQMRGEGKEAQARESDVVGVGGKPAWKKLLPWSAGRRGNEAAAMFCPRCWPPSTSSTRIMVPRYLGTYLGASMSSRACIYLTLVTIFQLVPGQRHY